MFNGYEFGDGVPECLPEEISDVFFETDHCENEEIDVNLNTYFNLPSLKESK